MKKNLYASLMAAASCALSCTALDDGLSESVTKDTHVPLSVSVRMAELPTRTLITGSSLSDGSEIGVSLYDSEGKIYDGLPYSNVRFTATRNGNLQEWIPETDVMLSAGKATAYAFYPYTAEASDLENIPVRATSESQTDYLYGLPAEGLYNHAPEASFIMKHALSAVRLSVRRGSYSGKGEVTGFAIKGKGTATGAILNALSGELSMTTGHGTPISPAIESFELSGTPVNMDVIMIPDGTEAPFEMEIIIDGQPFTLETDPTTLPQGTIAVYNASVDNTSINLSSVKVEDWTYDPAGNPVIKKDWTITLKGDIEDISFSNSVDDDGNVRIIAIPIPAHAEVNPVHVEGTATVQESVDDQRGIRTIILSDIRSDITVGFDGYSLWVTNTYQIDDISGPSTLVKNAGFGNICVTRMKVDGQEVTPAETFQFSEPGIHTARFAFIPDSGYGRDTIWFCVAEAAFNGISSLIETHIPEGYTKLRNRTYSDCTNLRTVHLPTTVTSMGYGTFYRCTSLTEITFPEKMEKFGYQQCYGCTNLTSVNLPPDLKAIANSAFESCTKLHEIEIPESVTSIGYSVFRFSGIRKLHIPDGVSMFDSQLCMFCNELEEVRLPRSLTSIKEQAFYSCSKLSRIIQADGTTDNEALVLPEGLESIDELAFYGAPFKSIHIPSTLREIAVTGLASNTVRTYTIHPENPAFEVRSNALIDRSTNILISGCLESRIDESVTTIGPKAFMFCPVTKIDFHEGVTEIQDQAFLDSHPTEIISRAPVPPKLGSGCFKVVTYDGILKVPAESMQSYIDQWMIDESGYLGNKLLRWKIMAIEEGE